MLLAGSSVSWLVWSVVCEAEGTRLAVTVYRDQSRVTLVSYRVQRRPGSKDGHRLSDRAKMTVSVGKGLRGWFYYNFPKMEVITKIWSPAGKWGARRAAAPCTLTGPNTLRGQIRTDFRNKLSHSMHCKSVGKALCLQEPDSQSQLIVRYLIVVSA